MTKGKIENLDFYLLIGGLLTRLAFAPFSRDPWDMDVWQSIGAAIISGKNPYALPFNGLVYPPLWAIFCASSHLSYTLTQSPFAFYFTVKLPIIATDIIMSVVIRIIAYNLTGDAKKARLAMILYLFNPVAIIMSSLWGMFDAIPTLFTLLSLVYLSQGKYLTSGLVLGIGIGFKGIFPALLLPFLMVYIWKKKKKLGICFRFVVFAFLVPLVASAPFLIINCHAYVSSILYTANRLPQNLTYWFSVRELLVLSGVPKDIISSIGLFIFVVSFSIFFVLFVKKRNLWLTREEAIDMTLLLTTILALLTFYITASTVNEQYLIWLLPFLILYTTKYAQSLRRLFYVLCGLDTLFVILNIGLRFFAPVVETPFWWSSFQYTTPSVILMMLTGILFSMVCITCLVKLMESAEGKRPSL
jgi:Gpi18-like mannosyltransferase